MLIKIFCYNGKVIYFPLSICIIILTTTSICSASSFNIDTSKLIKDIFLKPIYSQYILPQNQYSGSMHSSVVGNFRYPYIAFHNSIPSEAFPKLEHLLISKGYNPIGRNISFKVDGKLIASCRFNINRSRSYSNSNLSIYECKSECNLIDRENNFIVYTGQARVFGIDNENINNLKIKSSILSFMNLGNVPDKELYPVVIDGFDDGIRTNRKKDYDEAVLHAKKQAIEYAGVNISVSTESMRSYRNKNGHKSKYKEIKNKIESYASGIIAPGFIIVDHGYLNDGSYKVTLKGKIIQDPATAIRNNTDDNYKVNTPDTLNALNLLHNKSIQDIFEYGKINTLFDFNYPKGKMTFQIIRTFSGKSGIPCRTAKVTCHWLHQSFNFDACRGQYNRVWKLSE